MRLSVKEIIDENKKRNALRKATYDPITGQGSYTCERKRFHCIGITDKPIQIPVWCFISKTISALNECGSVEKYAQRRGVPYSKEVLEEVQHIYHSERIIYDFEYWAASDCFINDINSSSIINLVCNPAQRDFLKEFYICWYEDRPFHIIITKNRQNGFSTLIQAIFFWIQVVVKSNVNSIVCAHVENTAKIIRGMYSLMARMYPKEYTPQGDGLTLAPFEGSQKTKIIKETASRISIGSAKEPDALVGDKIMLFHASEVGLYGSTPNKTPEQLVQSIQSGIQDIGGTIIVYESTARGVGNFFHREWVRAVRGESGFIPMFVPWFKNANYEKRIRDYKKFVESLTMEEYRLFEMGATLEGLSWRRGKVKEYSDMSRFMQDFPATADEAFLSSGHRFYPIEDTARLRKGCIPPKFIGDILGDNVTGEESLNNMQFVEAHDGNLKVWFMPEDELYSDRYIIVMDIGGTRERGDKSVICVIDRKDMAHAGVPIVVAEWAGNVDYDILAWKAVQIATIYQKGLLVIESNTFEAKRISGENFESIMDEIAYYYPNLYARTDPKRVREGLPALWGFHTNKSTKRTVCNHQKKVLRENLYIETCAECVDEHDTFEESVNGGLDAREGCHDDRHITRAIGIWICYEELNPPRLRRPLSNKSKAKTKQLGLSSF